MSISHHNLHLQRDFPGTKRTTDDVLAANVSRN